MRLRDVHVLTIDDLLSHRTPLNAVAFTIQPETEDAHSDPHSITNDHSSHGG